MAQPLLEPVAPQQHLGSSSVVDASSLRSPSCLDKPSSVAAVRRNALAEGDCRGVDMADWVSVPVLDDEATLSACGGSESVDSARLFGRSADGVTIVGRVVARPCDGY